MSDTLILCYHAFSPAWPADLSVKPDLFARQLEILAHAGYRGVTFSEAVRRQARHREVAVTFDDAFASVATHARPVLDALGWPGSIFAVTDFAAAGAPVSWQGVDQWAGGPHDPERATLDWDGLRALRDAGWEVGSHTVTHPRLTQIADAELERELAHSREAIDAALGERCTSIAYPYGDVDPRVIDAAHAAGYAAGAALPARWGQIGALEWPRVGVYHPDDLRRFRLKTSQWTRRSRMLLGR
jgi:peptidoglycan/xylan/chitin deacetylase (PgdA/CDA1 family)